MDTLTSASLLKQIDKSGGVATVRRQLMAARQKDPKAALFPEVTVDIIGSDHMRAGDGKAALEIFKLNQFAYPESADANANLADAYLADGQRELARQFAGQGNDAAQFSFSARLILVGHGAAARPNPPQPRANSQETGRATMRIRLARHSDARRPKVFSVPTMLRRVTSMKQVRSRLRLAALMASLTISSYPGLTRAQTVDALAPQVLKYLKVSTPKAVLEHVQIIDGTGAAPISDRNLSIEGGKITAITAGADQSPSDGTTILNLRGYSVMPGIVGMHNHMFYFARPNLASDRRYESPALFVQMSYSAPRLYLANGVTTMRTTGSVEPYTDLKLKRAFEKGTLPGPHLDVTGPYLDGPGGNLQMPELAGPEDARQTVDYWADRGVTSFKVYAHITRAELAAAVKAAHKHGLKVTGHLCSVTYEEAIEAGIDNLEHGFFANTALDPDKKPDLCSDSGGDYTLEHLIPGGPEANRLIALLIKHHVAITSTLPGTASSIPAADASADARPTIRPAILEAMAPAARDAFLYARNRSASQEAQANTARQLRRDMDLERAFVAAGGLLLAGPDPVGINGLLPGFGDQYEIELLVEAGFTPVQAIQIATLNGAIFLGRQDRIGSIAVGKNADLVVMKGDPAARIADIENVEIVFKDGAG